MTVSLLIPDGTADKTTSHPTKQPENDCQVVGYSHSTKPASGQVTGYLPEGERDDISLREFHDNDRFALIYRDESLLVVNKPAGLLAVPGRGADKQDSMASRVQAGFPDALIVHRLDMATSGLIIFARGAEMQRRLSHLFRERGVQKRYVAVVAGRVEPAQGEVDLPLASDWPSRPKQKVDSASGKHSLTRYRLLEHDMKMNASRVELEPVTGRTHQLRVHMAAIGHPILGDALYGGEASSRAGRLLLHARVLSFAHPNSGEILSLECDPPF